jgi:hypothetical protein
VIADHGVLTPEQAVDPHTFLELYADFLHPPVEGAAAISRVES